MATLTYDPTPADQPEFSEEELDSLQRGEEMQESEQQLLAGKYQNAEELEKAYIELQKKLGGGEEEDGTPSSVEEEETEEEEVEVSAGEVLITDASVEFAESGELSPETMEKFGSMSSQELVEAYMQHRANNPQEEAAPVADLSESQVNYIKNQAGGEESYNTLVSWAGENLPDQYVAAFDNIVESGNVEAITIAVAGLRSQYEQVNGYEGRMLSGKGAPQQVDAFRSQAEVVQAMADPRYDNDPAYRNDVFEKLSRSNIDY
jgi:transposase-like protein